jgi:hypothetical protein
MKNVIKNKTYYVSLNKELNTIQISSTKISAAKFLGISSDTITRHMIKNRADTSKYTVWKNINIVKLQRGFALKHHHQD